MSPENIDTDISEQDVNHIADRIADRLIQHDLPHVSKVPNYRSHLISAVRRAIRCGVPIDVQTPDKTLIELIDTHEGQVDIHSMRGE